MTLRHFFMKHLRPRRFYSGRDAAHVWWQGLGEGRVRRITGMDGTAAELWWRALSVERQIDFHLQHRRFYEV